MIEDNLKKQLDAAFPSSLFSTVSPVAVGLKQEPTKTRKTHAKKRGATQAERYKIGKLLEENLSQKDENGLISYLNDMSDDKIAKLIGPHISHDTVRNMRQAVFGIVRKTYPRAPKTEVLTRIAKLEEMFNRLAEEAGSDLRI